MPDPPHELRESRVASTAHAPRTGQTRHRYGRDECEQVPGPQAKAAVTKMGDSAGLCKTTVPALGQKLLIQVQQGAPQTRFAEISRLIVTASCFPI